MEMNTRIQVEHPITEMICNIDIVKLQIKVAENQRLNIKQEDVKINGYAMECRINAENTKEDFKPSPGKITFLNLPVAEACEMKLAYTTDIQFLRFTMP